MNTDLNNVAFANPNDEADYWKLRSQELQNNLDEAREELEEFQASSRELEAELEIQLEQSETRCADLKFQLNKISLENESLKERLEGQQCQFHNEISHLQEELLGIKKIKDDLAKYIRELEQTNDDLERSKRATLSSLEDFEARLNSAIERNAFLESELDEKEALKEMVQRLKDEARDLRQEVKIKDIMDSPDNDMVVRQNRHFKQNYVMNGQFIDSNKLSSSNSSESLTTSNSCHNGNIPMMPSARISALNIVGDLLRKVGALESRLASCHTMVKDNQRPLATTGSSAR